MSNADKADTLLLKATSGDGPALHQLLLESYDQLASHVGRTIPRSIKGVVDADDIIQQTFAEVIREIQRFSPRADSSFFAWLKKIADNRTQDAIRRLTSKKRGGDHQRLYTSPELDDTSVEDVIELLSAGSHTPSRSAMRHEAVAAVQDAIDTLPTEYRQAVQLRLIAGKSLQETADIMNCSPRAVQGLVDRAKKKLRAALGHFSLYK